MPTYTSAELRHLAASTRPPSRTVRKSLFTFHLWRPTYQRSTTCGDGRQHATPLRKPSVVSDFAAERELGPADRSSSTSIGWLNVQSLRTKTDMISTSIIDRELDVVVLTETFHNASDDICLRLTTPPGYAVVDVARPNRRGGGVAVIFRKNWKSSILPLPACTKLEAIAVRLTVGADCFVILAVYRPGSEEVSSLFFEELATILETLVMFACPVIIGGDFNVKVNRSNDLGARRMSELLTCFDMVQHVTGPTHRCLN